MGAEKDRDGDGERPGLTLKQKAQWCLVIAGASLVVVACAILWIMGS